MQSDSSSLWDGTPNCRARSSNVILLLLSNCLRGSALLRSISSFSLILDWLCHTRACGLYVSVPESLPYGRSGAKSLTVLSIPDAATIGKVGCPSMQFTTWPSPFHMPTTSAVSLDQRNRRPSSEPETIYSSFGPRKFTIDGTSILYLSRDFGRLLAVFYSLKDRGKPSFSDCHKNAIISRHTIVFSIPAYRF